MASIGRHWKHGCPSPEAVVGNKILARTLEIINLLRPTYYFIENPRGMMRTLPIMATLPHRTVTYCQYGDTRQKPTDWWTNCTTWIPLSMCNRGDPCHEAAPRGARTGTQGLHGAKDRAVIPPLAEEIYEAVMKGLPLQRKKKRHRQKTTDTTRQQMILWGE